MEEGGGGGGVSESQKAYVLTYTFKQGKRGNCLV